MTTFFLGADHAGFSLKNVLRDALMVRGFEVEDLGTNSTDSVDYPDFAHAVTERIVEKNGALGVLVCGTGIGIMLAANKRPGIRAALCSETFSARMARLHNDANVLCLGSRVVGEGLAIEVLNAFVDTKFEGGRHARRVAKIEL